MGAQPALKIHPLLLSLACLSLSFFRSQSLMLQTMQVNDDTARAEASAMLQKLREQGVLPYDASSTVSPHPLSPPKTEDAIPCFVESDILRPQARRSSAEAVVLDDEAERTASNDSVAEGQAAVEGGDGERGEEGGWPESQMAFVGGQDRHLEELQLPDSSEKVAPREEQTEDKDGKKLQGTWTPIDAKLFDGIPESEMQSAVDAHNKNETTAEAAWLLEGAKHVKGELVDLVKVDVPKGTKKGARISFQYDTLMIKSVFQGQTTKQEGCTAVFAVHKKPPGAAISRKIASSLSRVGSWGARRGTRVTLPEAADDVVRTVVQIASVSLLSEYEPKDPKKVEFVYCDIECKEVEELSREDVSAALEARNRGAEEYMPTPLYEGLKRLPGKVLALVKLRVPEGTEEGAVLSFSFDIAHSTALYAGATATEARDAVFAVHEKAATTPLSRTLSSLSAGLRRSAGSPRDAAASDGEREVAAVGARRLEYVWTAVDGRLLAEEPEEALAGHVAAINRGETEGVPAFLAEGLAAHKGAVVGVVKVVVAGGTCKGQRVSFEHDGQTVGGVYLGAAQPEHVAVFAVREKQSLMSGLAHRVKSGLHKYDALRGFKDDAKTQEGKGCEAQECA